MTNPNFPSLTKTCASCGKHRTLSSFLQMTTDKGMLVYGNICAHCRKTEMEKAKAKAEEGDSRRETGRTIDNRTRVKSEADKKEKVIHERESYDEDRKEDAIKTTEISIKKESKEENERAARDSFLSGRSPLTGDTKKEAALQQKKAESVVIQTQNTRETTQQQVTNKQERITKGIDTSHAFIAPQSAEARFSGRFLEFAAWLGDAPMMRNIRRSMDQSSSGGSSEKANKETTKEAAKEIAKETHKETHKTAAKETHQETSHPHDKHPSHRSRGR